MQHVVAKNIFLYRITGQIQPNVGEGNSSFYKLMVKLDLFQRELIAKIHLKYYKNLLHLQRASLGSYKHGEGDSRFLKGHTYLHGEMIAKCNACSESSVLRAGRLVVLLKLFMSLRSFRTCI